MEANKVSIYLKCKKLVINPCKRVLRLFRFRLKKPLLIRSTRLRFRRSRKPRASSTSTTHFWGLHSFFRSLRKTREMDRLMQLKSFSDAGYQQKVPFPSPLTPAYIKMRRAGYGQGGVSGSGQEDVEDACRSFENYLVEMIVEEGKMRDLADVEELLYCWKNLKSPVFVNLVCRFYGELCRDLFSDDLGNDDVHVLA